MPAFANFTAKMADGTTDVTWVGILRPAGDNLPARYEQQTGFAVPAQRPKLAIASLPSNQGKSRTVKVDGIYPYYDASGLLRGSVRLQGLKITCDQALTTTEITQGVAQLLNTVATATVKASGVEGYAPA